MNTKIIIVTNDLIISNDKQTNCFIVNKYDKYDKGEFFF